MPRRNELPDYFLALRCLFGLRRAGVLFASGRSVPLAVLFTMSAWLPIGLRKLGAQFFQSLRLSACSLICVTLMSVFCKDNVSIDVTV